VYLREVWDAHVKGDREMSLIFEEMASHGFYEQEEASDNVNVCMMWCRRVVEAFEADDSSLLERLKVAANAQNLMCKQDPGQVSNALKSLFAAAAEHVYAYEAQVQGRVPARDLHEKAALMPRVVSSKQPRGPRIVTS